MFRLLLLWLGLKQQDGYWNSCYCVAKWEIKYTQVKKVKQLEEGRNARYFIFSFKVSYKFLMSVICHVINIVDGHFCGYLWPVVGMLGEEPADTWNCQAICPLNQAKALPSSGICLMTPKPVSLIFNTGKTHHFYRHDQAGMSHIPHVVQNMRKTERMLNGERLANEPSICRSFVEVV